jgi:cell shape-determining protein MreC
MLLYFKKNDFLEKKIKNVVIKISTPEILVINAVNRVFVMFNDIYYYIINTKSEILKLKQDNFLLKQQLMGFDYTKKENEQLKQIVNLASTKNIKKYKTIKLDILNNNIYSNIIRIAYGFNDGLHEKNLIMDINGNLIGRVINVGENDSEILLIINPISKISARTEKSKINMILYGNKTKFLNISYINGENYNFKNNERVFIHSNDDSSNFDIGVLVKTKQGFKVKINSDFNKINHGIIVLE